MILWLMEGAETIYYTNGQLLIVTGGLAKSESGREEETESCRKKHKNDK